MFKKKYKKLIQNVSNTIIIHFRCSDIPFNKHKSYHLPTINNLQFMINQIKNSNELFELTTCYDHAATDQSKSACKKYVEFYTKNIQSLLGKKLKIITCEDTMITFIKMVYCKKLVSLNSSSFSFMAGISKDPKDYISNNLGKEIKNFIPQHEGDWIYDKECPLLHNLVDSYYDVENVIKML